jgi:hypothetical protein
MGSLDAGLSASARFQRRSVIRDVRRSMCLILTVRLSKFDSQRSAEIAKAADLSGCRAKWRLPAFLKARQAALSIPGPEGGCGCSFLADSADWGAPTWDMIPETLPRLSSVLRAIRDHCSAGFAFEALWVGDSPTEERHVTIDELSSIVEQGRIGTKTRYLVS